jgi:MSHA biogenesis protein MshN
MSLLNDMLHDLAQQNTTPQISPRLKAVSAVRRHRKKIPMTHISFLVIWSAFFAVLLLTLNNHRTHNAAPQENPQTIIEAQTVVPTPDDARVQEINSADINAHLGQNLSDPALIQTPASQEITQIAAVPKSQYIAPVGSLLESQAVAQPADVSDAKLATSPAVIAQTDEISPDAEVPEWLLSYIEPLANSSNQWVNFNAETADLADSISTALVNKVYAPLSVEEWHDTQMNKVLAAIDEGADARATELLKTILIKTPQSVDARESLASIHLNNGNLSEASAIIEQGLSYMPANPSLLTIKARIFLEQGRSQEAIALLSRHHPSLARFPDYYGTLAAALQSEGRIVDAGSLYKALLQVEPDNSQYWLGYGMALEYNNKKNQAIEAYNRVTQGFEGDPAVRDYAENRLKTLQG